MDFLGVGPLELVFIIIIALIVLGPRDLSKAMRAFGRTLRRVTTSDTWQAITRIRYLPNLLMREAGLEEANEKLKQELAEAQADLSSLKMENLSEDLKKHASVDLSDWTTTPPVLPSPPPPSVTISPVPDENPQPDTPDNSIAQEKENLTPPPGAE
ncbi:MAG: twin-arginine translocase TatA/TatE family subunit [Chloroflexota bacterium]